MKQETVQTIRFTTTLFSIGTWTILSLPEDASAKLPSRGQTMVTGTMNGVKFQTPLEPDGKWSHWFMVDTSLLEATHAEAGDMVRVEVRPIKEWQEPEVPGDLQTALAADPQVHELWQQITPMARWEWVRWTRATPNPETRARRIAVACSKLKAGKRRPCCWNRNLCTEPSVSKNGILLEPTPLAN